MVFKIEDFSCFKDYVIQKPGLAYNVRGFIYFLDKFKKIYYNIVILDCFKMR